MRTGIIVLAAVVGLMTGCNQSNKEVTRHTTDSLRAELEQSKAVTKAMVEIGVLIDSIDANRKVLHTRMVEGTPYPSYVARMRDINQYVRKTQRKIAALERSLRKANTGIYAVAIRKLRHDLDVRNHEVTALQEQVRLFKRQNEDLVKTVSLQEAEIRDKQQQIKIKQEETAKLEEQVKHLMVQSKLDEGESYFSRARAMEEVANRTRFAPRKKKESIKQAIELYKLANFYGKDEALAKVTELEKKLTRSLLL